MRRQVTRRQIGIFIFIAQLFIFATSQIFAQQTPDKQNPSIPDDVLGSQLIAWSQLQKPEPVAQSESQEQRPVQPLDQASSLAQTFTDRTNTNTDRSDNDGSSSISSVTNRVDRPVLTSLKH
jgi:hypothetical protein